jgi:hypothetical protein
MARSSDILVARRDSQWDCDAALDKALDAAEVPYGGSFLAIRWDRGGHDSLASAQIVLTTVSAHLLTPFFRVPHDLIFGTTAAHIRLQPGLCRAREGRHTRYFLGSSNLRLLTPTTATASSLPKAAPRRPPPPRRPQSRRERYTWLFYLIPETCRRTALAG